MPHRSELLNLGPAAAKVAWSVETKDLASLVSLLRTLTLLPVLGSQ